MSLTIIIIGLFLLVSHFVPFYLVSHYQKKKKNKGLDFLNYFTNLANQQEIKISQSEIWKGCYCIGIDTVANKLFYLKKLKRMKKKQSLI